VDSRNLEFLDAFEDEPASDVSEMGHMPG
jgi:hypothetical protein